MGKWLTGIILLALLSIFASAIWPLQGLKRTAEMGETIKASLNANGFENINVAMRGNVAKLTGSVTSEQAAADAVAHAKGVPCKSCPGKKTWHTVTSDIDVVAPAIPTASPYTFDAVRGEDGAVVLNGYVRNDAEKARTLKEAEALFPGQVTDRTIRIAQGAPNGAWGDVISRNLEELALLERGRLNMQDNQSVLTGLANSAETRARVNAMVADLPTGYEGASNISVPDMAADNVGEVKLESVCQTLFNELKGDNKIEFNTSKASLSGSRNFDLLNSLASAAKQCASFRVAVTGHTDSVGSEGSNQALSEGRANAVVAYLADNDVPLERLSAKGMGETAPVASNDTSEGRARNRRIEFVVTQAE